MLVYKSFSENCTFYDVVLQCYLSLNFMPKFILDNGVTNLDLVTYAGQRFLFDPKLIEDEFINNEVLKNDYKFSTGQLRSTTPPTLRERYLLIESGEILSSESNNKFLI